jgi:hypothetical protein
MKEFFLKKYFCLKMTTHSVTEIILTAQLPDCKTAKLHNCITA